MHCCGIQVWNLTKTIAASEQIEDTEVCELGALLHDIEDWKYSGSETAGVEAAAKFLKENHYDTAKTETVLKIIKGVGFKEELAAEKVRSWQKQTCPIVCTVT
jgi:uncharacterized protein